MTKQILPEKTQVSAVTPRDELRLSATELAHEAHIKHLGAEMLKHMDQWVATGCFAARGAADGLWLQMKDAIAARSPEVVARMEAERGLA